jgi:hypothetical protein
MAVLGVGIYIILGAFQKGFIFEFWQLPKAWYSALILRIPAAEYIWYFLLGAFIGPLYEYWQQGRLVRK